MRRNQQERQIRRARNHCRAASSWLVLATFLFVLASGASAQTAAQAPYPKSPHATPASNSARRIVVSIPDHKLALVADGRVVKVYPVSVGAPESPSPKGEFKIARRLTDPTYYQPGVVIPAGPENPLGPRWIGLNLKSYGIHGTNQPQLIGYNASHGCIRMRNRDVKELFELVREGDAVELHGERDAATEAIFGGRENEQFAVVKFSGGAISSAPATPQR